MISCFYNIIHLQFIRSVCVYVCMCVCKYLCVECMRIQFSLSCLYEQSAVYRISFCVSIITMMETLILCDTNIIAFAKCVKRNHIQRRTKETVWCWYYIVSRKEQNGYNLGRNVATKDFCQFTYFHCFPLFFLDDKKRNENLKKKHIFWSTQMNFAETQMEKRNEEKNN